MLFAKLNKTFFLCAYSLIQIIKAVQLAKGVIGVEPSFSLLLVLRYSISPKRWEALLVLHRHKKRYDAAFVLPVNEETTGSHSLVSRPGVSSSRLQTLNFL